MVRNQRDEPNETTFAFTNWTNDPTVDCNGAVAVVGDGLGTVVNELIQLGIIQGSVAA